MVLKGTLAASKNQVKRKFDPGCHLASSCGFLILPSCFRFCFRKAVGLKDLFCAFGHEPASFSGNELSALPPLPGLCRDLLGRMQHPLARGKPWAGASPPCSIAPKPLASSPWRVCSGSEPAEQDSCLLPATLAVLGAGCCPSRPQLTPGCSVVQRWPLDVAAWGDSARVWPEMLSPKPGH